MCQHRDDDDVTGFTAVHSLCQQCYAALVAAAAAAALFAERQSAS
jgi:hypothetical protein